MIGREEFEFPPQQRSQTIANCEFPKVKLIDIQLKRLSGQFDDAQSTQKRMSEQLEYDKAKEVIRSEEARAHATAFDKLYRIDSEYRVRLVGLVTQHANEISRQAELFADDLELSAIRGVLDSIYLKREAQIIAKSGDFDPVITRRRTITATDPHTIPIIGAVLSPDCGSLSFRRSILIQDCVK
jgi:hypothetical protein